MSCKQEVSTLLPHQTWMLNVSEVLLGCVDVLGIVVYIYILVVVGSLGRLDYANDFVNMAKLQH